MEKDRHCLFDLEEGNLRLQDSHPSSSYGSTPRNPNPHRQEHFNGEEEEKDKSSTAMGSRHGETSGSGPRTLLPDKTLLDFIFDRLKERILSSGKDTHGIFSKPVDPDKVPDYLETIRNKLASGAYTDFEQFQQDLYSGNLTVAEPADQPALDVLANAAVNDRRSNSNHDMSGKGFPMDKPGNAGCEFEGTSVEHGKKPTLIDDYRRRTNNQPQLSTCAYELPELTASYGERKQLIPVGLHGSHSYAKSLARFAANLGPVGQAIAAKRNRKVLPHAIRPGRRWTEDRQPPQQASPRPSSQFKVPPCRIVPKRAKLSQRDNSSLNKNAIEAKHLSRSLNYMDVAEDARASKIERLLSTISGASHTIPKAPSQIHHNLVNPTMDGSNAAFNLSNPSEVGKMVHLLQDSSQLQKERSVLPDLNIRLQSPSSSDSQDLDLTLKL